MECGWNQLCGNYRFLPPMTMFRSGRSLERAVTVEPPTQPVPPSTRTRVLKRCLLAVGGMRSGMDALTIATMLQRRTAVMRRGLMGKRVWSLGRGAMRAQSWTCTWMQFGRVCGSGWTVDPIDSTLLKASCKVATSGPRTTAARDNLAQVWKRFKLSI